MLSSRLHDSLNNENNVMLGRSLGQPGISPNLQGVVALFHKCVDLSDRSVKEVACGGNHSVFLLEDGEVYTCGANTKGRWATERKETSRVSGPRWPR